MGLFRKSKDRTSQPTRGAVRTGACIYQGEPFPQRGERILISAYEVEFLLDRRDLPESWTGLAELIRDQTGEPRERRVLTNILGTLLAMLENKLGPLGEALDLQSSVELLRAELQSGLDDIPRSRSYFEASPRGGEYFDFELIKIVSLLASAKGGGARAEAGWPYPDIWRGDAAAFAYPY